MRRENRGAWFPLLLGLLVLGPLPALPQEGRSLGGFDWSLNVMGAYYFPNHGGLGTQGWAPIDYSPILGHDAPNALRDLGSAWGSAEAKAAVSAEKTYPFLVGKGPLTSGNHLSVKGTFELSPVSVNGIAQVSLSPVAFLVLNAGSGVGTGWTLGSFQGLGVNPRGNDVSSVELQSFGGAVWRVWGAATLQFDTAALRDGPWNHVVFSATWRLEYRAYTGATDGTAWLWEADLGENFNGTTLYGTYVIGYQMPLTWNFIGLMAESKEWVGAVRDYGPMANSQWGSDFRTWQGGPLANFQLDGKNSILVLAQGKYSPDWTDATTQNRDFRTRVYQGGYWYFNRIAVSYTRKL